MTNDFCGCSKRFHRKSKRSFQYDISRTTRDPFRKLIPEQCFQPNEFDLLLLFEIFHLNSQFKLLKALRCVFTRLHSSNKIKYSFAKLFVWIFFFFLATLLRQISYITKIFPVEYAISRNHQTSFFFFFLRFYKYPTTEIFKLVNHI